MKPSQKCQKELCRPRESTKKLVDSTKVSDEPGKCRDWRPEGKGDQNEGVEGELRIKLHKIGRLVLGPIFLQLLIVKYHQLGIGVEDLPQTLVDMVSAAVADHATAKFIGTVDDQTLLRQLHDFGIVKPGRHGDGT